MSIKYDIVRAELAALLKNDNAHMSFEEAVKDFPLETFEQQTIFIKPGFMPDFLEIPIRDRSDVAGWR
ncbi:MAG: hypothetical protein M0P57_12570 [Syntrophales bacterium]|nr:hypothetical protein [Syntrophales bacterium]